MKRTTILAIVAAVVGAAIILWLATRPRTSAALVTGATDSGEAGSSSRVVSAVGTGLTGVIAGIVDAAS